MKAKLENQPKAKTENKTPGKRGRHQAEIVFPKRKTGFTVDEVAQFRGNNVSTQTIREHLNKLTRRGKATAVSVPIGRGHPKYVYTLVA